MSSAANFSIRDQPVATGHNDLLGGVSAIAVIWLREFRSGHRVGDAVPKPIDVSVQRPPLEHPRVRHPPPRLCSFDSATWSEGIPESPG